MSMSRKDFKALADILADHVPVQGEAVDIQHHDLVNDIAAYCATTNPNFDRERFVAAAQRL
jgi:phage regulator Rha-like protein